LRARKIQKERVAIICLGINSISEIAIV